MKLFASDYDGTYCKHHQEGLRQLPLNHQAVLDWQQQGYRFGFSTGRVYPLMWLEAQQHQLTFDFMVAANGSLVLDQDLKVLAQICLDSTVATQIVQTIQRMGYENLMVSDGWDGYVYCPKEIPPIMQPVIDQLHEEGYFKLSLEEALEKPVVQISIMGLTRESLICLSKILKAQFGHVATIYPNTKSIDITPRQSSKALGLQVVAKHYNIPEDQIYCIGDSWNDVEMIETYQGFAMVEAPASIQEKASDCFDSVEAAIRSLLDSSENLN